MSRLAFLMVLALCGLVWAAEVPLVPTERLTLFNGSDLTGWIPFLQDPGRDPGDTWQVADGVIKCAGKPRGYLRSDKAYTNYHLHVEWRWPGKPGNSGVLIHQSGEDKIWPKSLECQLMANNAGDFWMIGGVEIDQHREGGPRVKGRRTRKLKDSSEKPLKEWNSYDIVARGDFVVVFVNGILQNLASRCSVESGHICLQSEGAAIEFRNVYLDPVE